MHAARSRLGVIAIATALVTLLVIVFFAYQDWRQYGVAFAKTNDARRTLALNGSLIDWMRDAETGQRGYLLTGQSTLSHTTLL
jgi:CHASE3 domain sensor protein